VSLRALLTLNQFKQKGFFLFMFLFFNLTYSQTISVGVAV
jgi:hypothetical protein